MIQIIDAENYLEGQLLVATTNITGSSFKHSVVLICAHGKEGTMGIIINHPLPNVEHSELFKQFGLSLSSTEVNDKALVNYGGPVEVNRGFVIYRHEDRFEEHAMLTIDDMGISGSTELLRAIAKGDGPEDYLLCLGYAGWSAGQLEKEMLDNSWITVPATSEIIFDPDQGQKWQKAAESCGVDLRKLASVAGNA